MAEFPLRKELLSSPVCPGTVEGLDPAAYGSNIKPTQEHRTVRSAGRIQKFKTLGGPSVILRVTLCVWSQPEGQSVVLCRACAVPLASLMLIINVINGLSSVKLENFKMPDWLTSFRNHPSHARVRTWVRAVPLG